MVFRSLGSYGNQAVTAKKRILYRSAAFPYEQAYRLINMYSLKEDLVLDPFLGTDTTLIVAITPQRNSIGYEIDPEFFELIIKNVL